mmetsp:Transcript_11753/g.38901  ORF Transcript_11753/g.38901 Transcript_11753/m.38901 type:complete len:241 (-) Transcript_11753:269-991(-)
MFAWLGWVVEEAKDADVSTHGSSEASPSATVASRVANHNLRGDASSGLRLEVDTLRKRVRGLEEQLEGAIAAAAAARESLEASERDRLAVQSALERAEAAGAQSTELTRANADLRVVNRQMALELEKQATELGAATLARKHAEDRLAEMLEHRIFGDAAAETIQWTKSPRTVRYTTSAGAGGVDFRPTLSGTPETSSHFEESEWSGLTIGPGPPSTRSSPRKDVSSELDSSAAKGCCVLQ